MRVLAFAVIAALALSASASAYATVTGAATAHDGDEVAASVALALMPEEPKSAGEKYFTETALVNQDGEEVRFYSDVLKGKTVVISSFYATDTESFITESLEKIQEGLGARVGKDVVLVSITVDPETDTPETLKVYAKKFNAKPGWMFLTGKKENVQTVLKKLGLYVADKHDHSNLLLVGNDATGLWKKVGGWAKPEVLLEVVETVMNDK